MKRIAVFFLFAATACWGADQKTDQKRLENVTWDLKHHKLIWTIQNGNVGKDGEFLQGKTETYEISPDDATMLVHDEKRGFTKEEASALHKLLDTLSLYCAESVVWWDRGEGERLDGKDKNQLPKAKEKKTPAPVDPKITRVALTQ
jgi:hypothetical protein